MDRADVVINAALKEGAVTVSFDCMAMGKPLICLDTTGYTRYFTNEYAILIPRTGRKEVIQNIKEGIVRLSDSKERKRLGQKHKKHLLNSHGRITGKKSGMRLSMLIYLTLLNKANASQLYFRTFPNKGSG